MIFQISYIAHIISPGLVTPNRLSFLEKNISSFSERLTCVNLNHQVCPQAMKNSISLKFSDVQRFHRRFTRQSIAGRTSDFDQLLKNLKQKVSKVINIYNLWFTRCTVKPDLRFRRRKKENLRSVKNELQIRLLGTRQKMPTMFVLPTKNKFNVLTTVYSLVLKPRHRYHWKQYSNVTHIWEDAKISASINHTRRVLTSFLKTSLFAFSLECFELNYVTKTSSKCDIIL